jgi:hypothetical protein
MILMKLLKSLYLRFVLPVGQLLGMYWMKLTVMQICLSGKNRLEKLDKMRRLHRHRQPHFRLNGL